VRCNEQTSVTALISLPDQRTHCEFVQVLDAFSSGVEAFKQMKNQYGLTENNIDDTMTEIQEVRVTANMCPVN